MLANHGRRIGQLDVCAGDGDGDKERGEAQVLGDAARQVIAWLTDRPTAWCCAAR